MLHWDLQGFKVELVNFLFPPPTFDEQYTGTVDFALQVVLIFRRVVAL